MKDALKFVGLILAVAVTGMAVYLFLDYIADRIIFGEWQRF